MNEHHEFRPAQRPDKRSDRPEGRFEARTDGKPERPRRSLRETVCDIDRAPVMRTSSKGLSMAAALLRGQANILSERGMLSVIS